VNTITIRVEIREKNLGRAYYYDSVFSPSAFKKKEKTLKAFLLYCYEASYVTLREKHTF
jgi:hypothetical protein